MEEKKIAPRIAVQSHKMFDLFCLSRKLDDSNVEEDRNSAFISIIGTPACLTEYLDEPYTKHWLSENHENVLNLDFDDISQDEYEWKGNTFYGMSMQQASDTVDFVERMIADGNRDFYIHCRAGISRSAAVGAWLRDFYPDYFFGEYLLRHGYNHDVYAKLSRAYYLKHGIFKEENNGD